MYQLSHMDEAFLIRLELTDNITQLHMLNGTTIDALKGEGILVIEDLLKLEPIAFAGIDDIDYSEMEKLEAIYRFIFRSSYENLHG